MNKKTTREKRFQVWMKHIAATEKNVTEIIKPIVDKYDPERLLAMGCPSDEYETTCKTIASGIVREGRMDEKKLGNLLAFVWHHDFHMWSEPVQYFDVFNQIAKEILPPLSDLSIQSEETMWEILSHWPPSEN